MTNDEMDRILADPTKRIIGDIRWEYAERRGALRLRTDVMSDGCPPLLLQGYFVYQLLKLSFALVCKEIPVEEKRVCALDLGKAHGSIGPKHKHLWREPGTLNIYVPEDIMAPASEPANVWT